MSDLETEGVVPPEPPPVVESEGWEPPTREEWQQVAQAYLDSRNQLMQAGAMIQHLQGQVDQYGNVQEEEEEDFQPDEMNEESFSQLINKHVTDAVQSALGEHPAITQMAEERGNAVAEDIFNRIEPQIGSFDRRLAITVAQAAHSRGMEAQQAVVYGATTAKAIRDEERQAGVKEYEEQLKNRLEAPVEPPVQGSAVTERQPPRTYDDVNKDFFARRRAGMAQN